MWSAPESGSQIEFDSFIHLARTAERGLFDFFFLAEGLRLREHRGRIHDLDVVGRPDTFTVLAALAAVTDRLGLTGTINTTFNEPFEVARQFATLDHLSDGRAGWNMVTSSDAFTGENFRRGGFLDHSDRYKRAEEFVTVAREFWDSWAPDAVRRRSGAAESTSTRAACGWSNIAGPQFNVRGVSTLPPAPQGHPVLLQAGDSADGRAFLAKYADAAFTMHSSLEAGQSYYADVKEQRRIVRPRSQPAQGLSGGHVRAGRHQPRRPEKARHIRREQVRRRPRSRCSSRCGSVTCLAMTRKARCPMWNRSTTRPSPRAGCGTATRRRSPGLA